MIIKIKMPKVSQVSIEFLMVVSMMLLIFMTMTALTSTGRDEINEFNERADLKDPCDYIVSLITNVYLMGDGAKIVDFLDYININLTIFGTNHLVLVSRLENVDTNKTIYCKYPRINVTNSYNTSFTIPGLVNFTLENINGTLEMREAALDAGLIAWWKMDNVNQTAPGAKVFDSVGDNYGVASADAVQVDGKFGKAYHFDGLADTIQIGKIFTTTETNFTIAVWVRQNATSRYVFSQWQSNKGLFLEDLGTGTLQVIVDGAIELQESSFWNADNKWEHLTLTFNGTHYVLYNNSQRLRDSTGFYPDFTPDINFHISDMHDGTRAWNGTIDDFRIYNRALSADEVKRLYESYFNYLDIHLDDIPK